MARARDYKAEYAQRIERGLARGLSRSQARGHPRPGEAYISGRVTLPSYDRRLEEGLKAIRAGGTLSKAAKSIHASSDRLRRYVVQTGIVEKRGRRWMVGDDPRPRVLPLYSAGQIQRITVQGYPDAAQVGRYMAAVKQFLDTNDPSVLEPFVGQSVTDVNGKQHVFETRPNALYRLTASRGEAFEDIYRIVV